MNNNLPQDEHYLTLDRSIPSPEDHALVLRHAPQIRFDVREPFFPNAVGYTVFRTDAPSPSFPRTITLPPGATCAIEYAIWWDWDMGHLYELEHIWVYLDAHENLVAAEASWHGGYNPMLTADGKIPVENGRVTIYSETGKHAFAPTSDNLLARFETTNRDCGILAGSMGVHVTPLFEGIIGDRNPPNNQLVRTYLNRLKFEPTFDFGNLLALEMVPHVPWQQLFEWIPTRMHWWAEELARTIPPQERLVWRIAHRGASAYTQENSIASLYKAVELGADMVEVDVRITADDVPIISHDADLKRVFGIEGLVEDKTLAELLDLTPLGKEPVLTFEEMVRICRELAIGIYLDIKALNEKAAAFMYEMLERHEMQRFTIWASFQPDKVAELKANFPKIQTSILFSSIHVEPVLIARAVNADYVHPCWERFDNPHTLLIETWIDNVRAAGLGIICWHEERPAVIRELQLRGVDGICSDQPELLAQYAVPQRIS